MSMILKYEIIETISDCINILSRGDQGVEEYEYLQKKHELEAARSVLESSKLVFRESFQNDGCMH